MKKLELKHLAPYLPYGLKGIFTDLPGGRPFELKGITIDDDDDGGEENIKVRACPGRYGGQVSEIINFKPILRTLNDFYQSEADEEIGKTRTGYIEVSKEGFHPDDLLLYDHFEILVKHHFDVFGLIDAGLAIDINTL